MLTKPKQDYTLENDVDVAPVPFRYLEVATSVQSYFRTRNCTKSAGECHLIACNGRDGQMFVRVKVEKKIRHHTLRSREWINLLYVTPRSEDPPLGLIDRQSRLSLGSTDMAGNINRKASGAEGIPDTLHACSWRLDGSR